MEGFPPRHPTGGADLPPPPLPQQHQQHQHTPPYWYPHPPPPPASSPSPHPAPPPPYSVPSYHHYPAPQPQPHNQQWPSPAYAPHPQPPPPPYGPPHAYPPGPPPPLPPGPPQQMHPYPPQNQAWPNQSWIPHQGQHFPGASVPQNDGQDWAAKAKAWAAAKSTTEAQNGRPVNHSYLQPKEASYTNGETSPASSQTVGGGVAVGVTGADPATLVSPVKHYGAFSAVYEQEVPSYPSSQGNKDVLGRYDNSHGHQPLTVPSVQDQFYHQLPDPSYMAHYGHNAHAGAVGVAGHDSVAAPHLWAPPGSAGPYQPPTLPPLPAQQYDISTGVHPSVSVPNYGPLNAPPVAFNAPSVASHLNTELFHGDPSTLNQVDRPKKSAVPSWLREEILKKKTTVVSSSSAQVASDGGEKSPETTDQADSKSADSTKSAEEEDDEDEVEAARTAAINQEIKRILTEVLLKVTDDLFDEIATKVLSEDDMAVEATSEPTSTAKPKLYDSAPPASASAKVQEKTSNGSATSAKAAVPDEAKGGGALLGLSDYGTDDDDGDDGNASKDRIKQNLEPETNNSSSLMQKDVSSDQNLVNHEEYTEINLKSEGAEVPSLSEEIVGTKCEEESHAKEESYTEIKIGQIITGEVSQDRFVDGNDNIQEMKVTVDSKDWLKDDRERGKEGNAGVSKDEEDRSKDEKDVIAEMIEGKDDRVNILDDRRQRSREEEREPERRYDKETKLDSLKGNKREISKEEKERATERDVKEDNREKSEEERERKTERRDGKEDSSKDRRERSREERERRTERRDKSERSKEVRERETDKRDDKERSRRSKRSPSPRGRSRSKERSRASREQSESIKRRRTESNKRSMSRSPPRSRHRRDLRSPHSKHSHHRNSAYSTSDRRRSRSRSPTRRRRSRSRTPSRRR